MSTPRIRAILESRLATWAAARVPALPVLWENAREDMEPSADHLRAFVMPATTLAMTLEGNDRRYVGIFQASIYVVPGSGPRKAEAIVAELDALFPNAERFSDASGFALQVATPVSAMTAQQEPGWFHIAASFRYLAFDAG